MLVIDLIEREVLDDPLHVEELHDEDTVRVECFTDAVRDGVKLLQMKKNAGGVNGVKVASEPIDQVAVEEGVDRRHTIFLSQLGGRL
jgi:hypothetical protein